jgi:hypothetical protein
MVKLVGVVRNFRVHYKHVQIDLEDGTGLLRVIFWWKQKECTAQYHLIDKCNGNGYIRVIGEVADYYGVHEIIAFDIRPVSSGNEVTHHLLEVAYSYEKRLESVEDVMMKSDLLVLFFVDCPIMFSFLMLTVCYYLLLIFHSLSAKYSIIHCA